MIDEDAIRYRWEYGRLASSTSAAGACSRRPRCGPPAGAGWRWSPGSPGSPARRSIAARTISTRRRCRRGRFAAPAAGARRLAENDPELVPELKRLVEPATLGDPMRPLLWVSKSMDKLAATLTAMGHPISADTVRKELVKLGFSRQSQSQGRRRLAASGPQRAVRAHQREGRRGAGCRSNRSSPSTRRRRSWSATSRTAAPTIAPRAIRAA